MKNNKLYKKLVGIYEENGAGAVFDYAQKNGSQFERSFSLCAPCEDETPTIKGDECCAVCGSVRSLGK
jgi:hypothetical protein